MLEEIRVDVPPWSAPPYREEGEKQLEKGSGEWRLERRPVASPTEHAEAFEYFYSNGNREAAMKVAREICIDVHHESKGL